MVEKYATEAIAPVQNKVRQFLSASIVRNIVAQVKSTIDLRGIMDSGKILIVNLSKGKIGEDNMRLFGGMMITKWRHGGHGARGYQERGGPAGFLSVRRRIPEFRQRGRSPPFFPRPGNTISTSSWPHQYIEQLDEGRGGHLRQRRHHHRSVSAVRTGVDGEANSRRR